MISDKINLILKSKIFIILLIVLAFLSILHAFNISISDRGSTDFSISPAILFWDKINPYEYFLYSDNTEKIIGWQVPIYAHATYVIFYFYQL